jgi:hypothetical protein
VRFRFVVFPARSRPRAPSGAATALLLRAPAALLAFALLWAAAALQASEPQKILFVDGTFRPCEILLLRDNGIDARLEGKVLFLPWDRLDPAQAVLLQFERLGKGPGAPPVRARFDAARDCLAQGLVEYGRRQILAIAREHPLLAGVTDVWLSDFPSSAAATDLAEGIDALLSSRWEDVYAPLKKAAAAGPDSGEQATARRYLKIYIEAGGRIPAGEPGEPSDPGQASRIRVIQGRLNLAWGRTDEALRAFREGRVTDMRKTFAEAEVLLDKAAAEAENSLRALPECRQKTETSDLLARAVRDLLELNIRQAECSLDLRLWTDADEAITKAEKRSPANEKVKALRDLLTKLYRKKPS